MFLANSFVYDNGSVSKSPELHTVSGASKKCYMGQPGGDSKNLLGGKPKRLLHGCVACSFVDLEFAELNKPCNAK